MGKRRDWQATYNSWAASGMTISGFCKSNRISISAFYSGIRKLGLPTARSAKTHRSDLPTVIGAKFVQARIIGRDTEATIVFPNNITVKTGGLSSQLLSTLYFLGTGCEV